MEFIPKCMVTAVGSFPHQDPKKACEDIFEYLPEIPVWPQLPRTDFREQMEIQFSEGLPCVVTDEAAEKIYFDTSGDPTGELEKFYENVLMENLDYFQISQRYSRGVYEMIRELSKMDCSSIKYFKSQITGPVTFGLSKVDENKRAIYYNEVFRDVVVKGLAMKARWLLSQFRPLLDKHICFIDEPIFSAFGSSTYVSVQRKDVVSCLGEVVEAVHNEGVLAGTHCCGNTEWTILIDAGVDIVNFDAYEYGKTIGLYHEDIGKFLGDGGVLAWGVVPTSEKINDETPDSLAKLLEGHMDDLADKGIDKNLLWDQCLLTPSCGTGTLTEDMSVKVLQTLSKLGKLLR